MLIYDYGLGHAHPPFETTYDDLRAYLDKNDEPLLNLDSNVDVKSFLGEFS